MKNLKKLFAVVGLDKCNPCRDNFVASFYNKQDAQQFIDRDDTYDDYEIVIISYRL